VATGKVGSGRPAREAAGEALFNVAVKSSKSASKEPVAAAAPVTESTTPNNRAASGQVGLVPQVPGYKVPVSNLFWEV